MLVLGIESSCDETAASVTIDGRTVLSNVIYSQIETHKKYGGVVPEIASRAHIEKIIDVIDSAVKEAEIDKNELDIIAVTNGPGLVGALLVGVSCAKAIAFALDKPLVAVNHIHGHICANFVANKDLKPPFVCLVASGGHSHIVMVEDYLKFRILGATKDDAAGEAFDKVARVMGLGYPGGPKINEVAKTGNENAVNFPRPINGLDFSFSGVKTAVINHIHKLEQKGERVDVPDIAASFQKAVVDVLVKCTINAAIKEGVKTICLAGGVAANSALRTAMSNAANEEGIQIYYPPMELCTDNAAMISCAGYYNYENKQNADLSLNAIPQLESF